MPLPAGVLSRTLNASARGKRRDTACLPPGQTATANLFARIQDEGRANAFDGIRIAPGTRNDNDDRFGLAVPGAVLAAITQSAVICQKAPIYSGFVGDLPPFWADAGETLGNLVIQMQVTGKAFTPEQFGTGLAAAAALNPLRIELHADQVAYLPDSNAALSLS